LPSASPFTWEAVAQPLTADPHLAFCLSEAFSTRASDLKPSWAACASPELDLRLALPPVCAPRFAPRLASPHGDRAFQLVDLSAALGAGRV